MMKTTMTLKTSLALVLMSAMALVAAAHDSERPDVGSNMLYAPLVYDNYKSTPAASAMASEKANQLYALDAGDEWLQEAMDDAARTRQLRQRVMIKNPQLVAYNANRLPEAPPEGEEAL